MTENTLAHENEEPKSETLLEQLKVLEEYLVERANRVGRHEDGAMAYENSARLLRNILKNRKEPEIEWGVRYIDGFNTVQHYWGLVTDPRLPRVIDGKTFKPQIDEDGVINLHFIEGEVTHVAKRTKSVQIGEWEPFEA